MECIEAKGTIKNASYDAKGYGQIQTPGRTVKAHRHVWEECFGLIPDGLCICHHCDNPACVNPAHLFLGTHADNMRDMREKGRVRRGSKHPRSKLTEDDVRAIRLSALSNAELARRYQVTEPSIHQIVTRRTWAWLD